MIASRLDVPVVPVRIEGLDKVLHPTWRMARPGPVRVAFGAPLRLAGRGLRGAGATQVEEAVEGARDCAAPVPEPVAQCRLWHNVCSTRKDTLAV